MSNYSTETLTALLKGIKKDIDKGFGGVHKRLDITNHNVFKNTKYRYITMGVALLASFLGVASIVNILK